MNELINMSDQELRERYLGIKVAMAECGIDKKIMDAYIQCTSEISMRYFDKIGLIDRESRMRLIQRIGE